MRLRLIITAAVLISCMSLLSGCGDKEEAGIPEEYEIGGESVKALIVEEKKFKLSESGVNEETSAMTYTYSGFKETSPGSAAQAYMELMTSEEYGFKVVTTELEDAEPPDFTSEIGLVQLARDAAEDETKVLLLRVDWTKKGCIVATSVADKPMDELTGLTHIEAVDYMNTLYPGDLGLEGENMDDYHVYVMDGLVNVDGMICMCLKVYSNGNPESTNDYLGTYFMTRDGLHIYLLNDETNAVRELDIQW